jgi:hypothetical protein
VEYKTLSPEQIQHFLDYGFVHLTDCFDTEFAAQSTAAAFNRLGYVEADPSTWERPIIHMSNESVVQVKDFSPKAYGAFCDLLGGEDRIAQPVQWWDGYIVNFKLGAEREWVSPSPEAGGWHKDGDFFWHFLDSPEQGLLVIAVWRDIVPQGGGTFIACDSVKPIAEYLNNHREGLHPFENRFGGLISECQDFREVTAKAGDVIILHPYMLHASSQNHSGKARFITNPPVALKEPMNFNRENPADFSPVEQVVLNALGVDRLDFQLQGERRRFDAKAYREARAREKQP